MRSKLPKALSDERKRKEVEEKQRQVQQLEEELGRTKQTTQTKVNKGRTYNLLDIKEAVQIKPQDYSKAINTKEFQFVQKPRDGTQNWEVGGGKASSHYTSEVTKPSKKGKGLRSRYGLA